MDDSEDAAAGRQSHDVEVEAMEIDELPADRVELGEGDEEDGDRSVRLGFRGIPTWEEAIGLIVSKNLEARAKRPASGSHSGRGRRGPRDKRGQGGK